MSFSNTPVISAPGQPVSSFQYRSTMEAPGAASEDTSRSAELKEPVVTITQRDLSDRLAAERSAGFAEAEQRMRAEYEQKLDLQNKRISKSIVSFEAAQKEYFSKVEAEVVQLALAIAGKILHREAQVDPMLVAAIVHLALGQLKEGSGATIRVRSDQAERWREHITSVALGIAVRVVEDPDLERGDCILETELGTVNFSLDAQLKEVESGFFDVLAQKPVV